MKIEAANKIQEHRKDKKKEKYMQFFRTFLYVFYPLREIIIDKWNLFISGSNPFVKINRFHNKHKNHKSINFLLSPFLSVEGLCLLSHHITSSSHYLLHLTKSYVSGMSFDLQLQNV